MAIQRCTRNLILLACISFLSACSARHGTEPGIQTGSLQIGSVPTGASITLDGQQTDEKTPFTFDGLSAGWHTIQLSLADFVDWQDSVQVFADTAINLSVNLFPLTADLGVTSNPPNAQIWWDGQNTHLTTPSHISSLMVGDHSLMLILDGYETFSDSVHLVPDQLLEVHADLIQLPCDPYVPMLDSTSWEFPDEYMVPVSTSFDVTVQCHDSLDDDEAEIIALVVSGQPCAPWELYERIRGDLVLIRDEWGDSIPAVRRITYRAPWEAGTILVGIEESMFNAVCIGQYQAWDSLNPAYGIEGVGLGCDGNPGPVQFYFGDSTNLLEARAAYETLPGISWASLRGSFILIGGDGDTLASMRTGTYTAWDDLNCLYDLDSIRFLSDFRPRYVTLRSQYKLNPLRLAGAYSRLPGVRYAEPDRISGDGPGIHVYGYGETLDYIFRDAWGDCPAGCMEEHFWGFRSIAGHVQYLGEWNEYPP